MSPSPPADAARLKQALDRAIQEPLSAADRKQAIDFIRTEMPAFEVSGQTTYLVLGSYRGEFEQNLRLVQSELNKRTDTFAAVVGDLRDPDFKDRSPFAIKLHLTATYADWVVGVYEKESGGESPELGVIYSLYFKKTHVLPRDYAWMTDNKIDSSEGVRRAALQIFFNDDLDDKEKASELEGLYRLVKEHEIGITREEIEETIRQRERTGDTVASYSWVHVSFFRDFERTDRCHPWFTNQELRERANTVPGPRSPRWEADWKPDDVL